MSESLDEEHSSKEKNKNDLSDTEIVDWKKEFIQGNMMPGIIMLEQKRINVDDIVNPENGNTMLHYAAYYGFYNVFRSLIEIYNADYNKQNNCGFTPLFFIVSNTDANIFNFQYFTKIKNLNYNLEDLNGLNVLVHSIIANFHYAFLFFMYL